MTYRVVSPLVTAKDPQGRIYYYYENINPIIPWLSEEQREQFLAEGLVEEVGDGEPMEAVVTYPTAPVPTAAALAEPRRSLTDYLTLPAGVPMPEPDAGPLRELWRHQTGIAIREQAGQDGAAAGKSVVTDCIGILERLEVPASSGAPTAREALRANGHRFANDVIAAAVKARK